MKKIRNNMGRNISTKRINNKIFYLFCFFISSCNIFENNDSEKRPQESVKEISSIPIHYESPNSIYKRDSLFVATTVWQFIDKEVDVFDYYKQYKVPLDKLGIDVDTIFYSPDNLKLFAFVIESDPGTQFGQSEKYGYSGNSLIGFRANLKTCWTIYNYDQFSISALRNYNDVRDSFRKYYLGDGRFKEDADYYWDATKAKRISISFGYNIDDKRFWDNSIVWKKGSRIPGYYSFETEGNVKPGDEDAIKIIPHLDYPDSLLKLYK